MKQTRRDFLKTALLGGAGALAIPPIICSCSTVRPSRVRGVDTPGKQINILQIGCGRIGREMDMPGFLRHPDLARIVAVCDVDSLRVQDAKKLVEESCAQRHLPADVATYGDYREALQRADVDAVAISTPDHWHAEPVMAAALAGKDIYVQKPLTMTIQEGRAVSDIVRAKGAIFQIGSQQRSGAQFRLACELVRSGRLGKLHTVKIGLPTDPAGGNPAPMPVPPNLNYDMWLGGTPEAPYTLDRVHAQGPGISQRYAQRPGWLRIENYCLGMITGWGSHHVDIAHWGMDTELTGPIAAEGRAEFPTQGLWNVHGPYHIEMKYANGVTMIIDNKFENGIRFEGADGWLFVTRGAEKVTASDPAVGRQKSFLASNPDIIRTPLGKQDIRLHVSPKGDHHLDWLTAVQARRSAVTSVEPAHRSCSACMVGWIAMKLGRRLIWDPAQEEFLNDDAANALRARSQRAPYGIANLKKS